MQTSGEGLRSSSPLSLLNNEVLPLFSLQPSASSTQEAKVEEKRRAVRSRRLKPQEFAPPLKKQTKNTNKIRCFLYWSTNLPQVDNLTSHLMLVSWIMYNTGQKVPLIRSFSCKHHKHFCLHWKLLLLQFNPPPIKNSVDWSVLLSTGDQIQLKPWNKEPFQ